jgi:hypothetical protein
MDGARLNEFGGGRREWIGLRVEDAGYRYDQKHRQTNLRQLLKRQ